MIPRGVNQDIWPQTLEALGNLDKTNPTIFSELSSNSAQTSFIFETESETEFADAIEDASDIPLEVVQHIASNSWHCE